VADAPRVAVVIVNFNAGEFLPRALDALGAQTVRPNRTIVVDNASGDGSPETVAERYPHVELIPLERNAGFAAANNVGVRAAGDCEWVALLNPDAFPSPGWLEALLGAARENPRHSFFGSHMLQARDPDRIDGLGDAYHVSGLSWRREQGRRAVGRRAPFTAVDTFSACAGAALYRRDVFLEAGGFDETFFCYIEDSELAFRLRLQGHRCRYVPEAEVLHVGSALSGVDSDFTVYYSNRNLVWAWMKNMPSPLLWLYLPQHLLVNASMVLLYALKGQGRVVLAAKRDALRALPRVRRARAEAQARRAVGCFDLRRSMERGLSAYQGTRARGPVDRLLDRLGLLDRHAPGSA
jgi:GT2 family glycosyltransferase